MPLECEVGAGGDESDCAAQVLLAVGVTSCWVIHEIPVQNKLKCDCTFAQKPTSADMTDMAGLLAGCVAQLRAVYPYCAESVTGSAALSEQPPGG